ncbi:NADH-quinone oxidoreductase subunit L [Desulfuromonas sp. TF]|uniref:NADH-quinone oxidoreductase subunit 5 family protein n=1 Tax=Desulfuromonas sp. TF TaxID=1232410 RepID=UPI0004845767|nr:proton-conducting transporter membrane subunit [Desulfuromonas sp. TF]
MKILLFLIMFPLLISLLALILPRGLGSKKTVGAVANGLLCAVPIYLLITYLDRGPAFFRLESRLIDLVMLLVELAIAAFLLYLSFKAKRVLPALLVLIQTAIILTLEATAGHGLHVEHSLFVDKFSIIMALIIGIIGSAICLYAFGYMPEFHEHYKEVKDRRNTFGFLMYLFLSAMFGIVFSNNLMWLYFFWEITTVCSFLLIGYKNDEASRESAFRALNMNLIGGVVFAAGLLHLASSSGIMELDKLLRLDQGVVLLPAACLAFAGLAKSAQFPFSSWLTGAMVAPTPVSALLHSSTMVKAGVYLILRVSPIMENTAAAKMLTLIGGTSFLIAALIAISQSNAKKVLAYSTISNLGLIVACAGVNTDAAVWSALLLIIFHAVAKSLLFLCVGIIEYKLGSRDIEDMDYLIMRLPKLTAVMMIGMAGMFLAPFGMIISKFITLKAFVESNPAMVVILAYGSAATVLFWTKWMGKIMTIRHGVAEVVEHRVSRWEWTTLGILAVATVAVCLTFPFISFHVIDPWLRELFGTVPVVDTFNVLVVFAIMLGLLIILPLGLLYYAFVDKTYKRVGIYLGGGNIDNNTFEGAMASTQTIQMKNYYLERYFGEERLFNVGLFVSLTLTFIMFGAAAI